MHGTFVLFGIDFPAYFTLLMLGFLAGIWLAWRHAAAARINPNVILDFGMLLVIGGVGGGRLAHVLFDGQLTDYYYLCVDPMQTSGELLPTAVPSKCTEDSQCVTANVGDLCNLERGTCHSERDCLRPLKFWYGGLTYYGGFIVAIPLGLWFLRRRQVNPWKVGDMAAFAVPLGIGFGRLGCFFAGCCFGSTCDVPWGVSFPTGSPAWRTHHEGGLVLASDASFPVHPTQLYESIGCFALAGVMLWFYHRRRQYYGQGFWLMAIAYAVMRFLIEMVRADDRGGGFGLSTSQIISICFVVAAMGMFPYLRRLPQTDTPVPRRTQHPEETPPAPPA